MQVYVFDKDGQPAYIKPNVEQQKAVTLKQLLGDGLTNNSTDLIHGYLNQSNAILTYQQSPLSHWNIVLVEPKSVLLSSIKVVDRLTVIVIIMFIILSFIMIFIITLQMTKNIRKTVDLIRHVNIDNLSIEFNDSCNEIILINRAIHNMFARLKDSMEKDVQARSRELKAHINALESQMNPHFLYNVLSVIGAVGEEAGVDKVMILCEKLSGMLRYTSKYQDNEVTIRDELTYAQHYLDLMKERFEDHFHYRLEMDEETLALKVPRLTLQPLIENCFRHAFQKTNPPWEIHLSIKQTSDHCWLFEVKDKGDGFDPAVLEKLHQKIDSYDKSTDYSSKTEESSGDQGGIGLFNTFMRLRLTYNELAFYEILTNNPVGTIVRIGVKQKGSLFP
jgi:sensor histidine kinase YesM